MTVDALAITTLANLKTHLGITTATDDTVLEDAIDAASYAIEAYLDRGIVQRRVYEWTTAHGDNGLLLKVTPVSHVHYVGFGSLACMTISSAVSGDISATVSVNTQKLVLTRTDSSGNETVTSINYSNHKTSTALAATINATAGFSATVSVNCASYRINRVVGRDLIDAPLVMTFADQAQLDVTGDLSRGILYIGNGAYDDGNGGRWPSAPVSVFVDYDGGYETVPYDIVQACLLIAARMYQQRKRDTSLASESFGDYSYSAAAVDAIDAEAMRLLAPYKRIR